MKAQNDAQASGISYEWVASLDSALAHQVIELYNDSIRTENILGYTQPLTAAEGNCVVERMDQAVRRQEKHFFGILQNQRLIGMALLTPNALPNCQHLVEWSKGIIHSEYRGRGVLRPALHSLATTCHERGWEVITLDVRADSRAHKLWSAFGFKEYGRLMDYARIDGRSQTGAYLCCLTSDLLRQCTPI